MRNVYLSALVDYTLNLETVTKAIAVHVICDDRLINDKEHLMDLYENMVCDFFNVSNINSLHVISEKLYDTYMIRIG